MASATLTWFVRYSGQQVMVANKDNKDPAGNMDREQQNREKQTGIPFWPLGWQKKRIATISLKSSQGEVIHDFLK